MKKLAMKHCINPECINNPVVTTRHRVVGEGFDVIGGPDERYCAECAGEKIYELRGLLADALQGEGDRIKKLETQSQLMRSVAELYRIVLERCGSEGALLEREVAELRKLKTEFASTLTDEDYMGSDPTDLFDNPLPIRPHSDIRTDSDVEFSF